MSHHPERTARNVRPVNQPPSKKNLLSHEFKFTIFFTRDTGYYQRRKNGWAWRSFCFDDCLEISQKLDVSNPVYVYTSDRGDALFEEAKKSGFDILGSSGISVGHFRPPEL